MQITGKSYVASVLATAVIAGAIGAFAASAVSSEASPQAIATAVQRVSDQNAERSLRFAAIELQAVNAGEEALETGQKQLQGTADSIEKNDSNICWDTASPAQRGSCIP